MPAYRRVEAGRDARPAPAATRMSRSLSVAQRPEPNSEPRTPPRWMIGRSRPSDAPVLIEITEAKLRTQSRFGFNRACRYEMA